MFAVFIRTRSQLRSSSCPRIYATLAEAEKATRRTGDPELYDIRPHVPTAGERKERRNRLQQARRASPKAKKAEALASRKSYWRKACAAEGFQLSTINSLPARRCSCSVCRRLRKAGIKTGELAAA